MIMFRSSVAVVMFILLLAPSAPGKDHWDKVGVFDAGDASEVSVSGTVPKCKIKCLEGKVSINTLVIREGSKKTSITVSRHLNEQEDFIINLNDSDKVTGLRISATGKGKYEVHVVSGGSSAPSRNKSRDGWQGLGEFKASGEAQEVQHSGRVSECRIECTEGSIVINTLVVREGGQKTPITVSAKFNAGEHKDIRIGAKNSVTGFRISSSGKGKYRISVK